MAKIFCLGPNGTFSILAANRFNQDNEHEIVPLKSIDEVLINLLKDEQDFAVLPIENTIAGVVGVHQDLLVDYRQKYNVTIQAEVDCQIKFSLIANREDLSQINYIYSHPHAIEQCQLFKIKHMPAAQIKYTKSTAYAADLFIEKCATDAIAAIIPTNLAEMDDKLTKYINNHSPQGIQDVESNATRFLILSIDSNPPDFTKHKTSIFVETIKDEPALLFNLISPLANLKFNMSFLHSKSSHTVPWVYNFFIDFINKPNHPNDSQLLVDVLSRNESTKITILGSYDSFRNK